MSDDSDDSEPRQYKRRSPRIVDNSDKEIELLEENNKLRKKLRQLSLKFDEQLEKAAKQKLKNSVSYVHATSPQSQNLELKNAYKMIERLQKTVRTYEQNETYQISHKRILDLQNIIKKKETEIETLKLEVKTGKKTMREKEKLIQDLIDKQAVNKNLNQEKQIIAGLKDKMKKLIAENDKLKKTQMSKHRQLVSAERRIVEMEQEEEQPIGKQEELLQELEETKNKYKEAMMRIEKQNAYITKLNSKLTNLEHMMPIKKSPHARRVQSTNLTANEKKMISRSVDELPELSKEKVKTSIFDHIPSPNMPGRLRRY